MNLSPLVGVQLVTETCCVCAVTFAMPEDLVRKRREDQKSFHCPNGHAQSYLKSEADNLRAELQRVQDSLNACRLRVEEERQAKRHEERRVIALKGALTKAKRSRRG